MASLQLENIEKRFGTVVAVQSTNAQIASGEFFSIVGPSGCGKTTILRMIAGFEQPSAGRILMDGEDVTGLPPQRRHVGIVFQNYALFPHMTSKGNIAFGLKAQGRPRKEVDETVDRMLGIVRLTHKKDAPVPTLSGGEQQRVAVARALAANPAFLLFDEPLSNLDAALRQQTRDELRSIQRSTGITTVYVTHDQGEALSLSDRIAVMRGGKIEQIGTPTDVYEKPLTPFVAQFLGGANLLHGSLAPDTRRFVSGPFSVQLPESLGTIPAGRAILAARPEAITLVPVQLGEVSGEVESMEYLGSVINVTLRVSGLLLKVAVAGRDPGRRLLPSDRLGVHFDWERCTIFPGWE